MITSLHIRNFRGIRDLSLEDFGTVNIFVGGNGFGKTSVLEALFTASHPHNPGPITSLAVWREQAPPTSRNPDGLTTLFPEMDLSTSPTFDFCIDGQLNSLSITPLAETAEFQVPVETTDAPPADFSIPTLKGLEFTLRAPSAAPRTSRLMLGPNGAQVKTATYAEALGSFYIHARRATSVSETADLLTFLSERKKEREFLDAVKSIDTRVLGIEVGSRAKTPILLVDIGFPVKLPVQVMGDGFCRTLLMATGAFSKNTKLLIVDEIDSGLHVSKMMEFWKSIMRLLSLRTKQLFCATHDDEMLMNTIDAFEDNRDALRIFRVERGPDGVHSAKRFTYEDYKKAALKGAEIR